MLNQMRNAASSFIAKIFAALLMLSFGIWGISDFIHSHVQSDKVVATVGSQKIDSRTFDLAFSRQMQRLAPMFKGQLTRQMAAQIGLGQQALRDLVQEALFDQAGNDLGILIGDKVVAREIRNDPTFKGVTGQFSHRRLLEILQRADLTEQEYINLVRRDMAQRFVVESLTGGVTAPDIMAREIWKVQNEQRQGETLTIKNAAQTNIPTPTEAQLKKYHDDHKVEFTAPQYRKVTYVFIKTTEVAKGIPVTEDELKQAYDTYAGDFQKPAARHLEQMILPTEKAAKAAAKEVEGGADFAKVAADKAKMKGDAIDLGLVTQKDLLPQIAKVAFAAKVKAGDVVGPVKSPLGWHVIKVTKVIPAETKSFSSVRDQLKAKVQQNKATDVVYKLGNKLDDKVGGGATLEEAAKALNLQVHTVDRIDRRGNDAKGNAVKGLPPGDFLKVAFDSEKGVESTLNEAGNAGYYMLRVDDIIKSHVRPLAEVKDKVTAAWKADQQQAEAKKKADEAAKRLGDGAALKEVATSVGGTVGETPMVKRDERNKDVPPAVHAALFSAKLDGAKVAAVNGGFTVVRPTKVVAADPASDKKAVDQTAKQLQQHMQNDVAAELSTALENHYGVKVHQQAMERVLHRGS